MKRLPWCGVSLGAGVVGGVGMAWFCARMTQGGAGTAWAVGVCLALLAALCMAVLRREGARREWLLLLLGPVVLSFALRAACMEYASEDYLYFLTHWVEHFHTNGGFAAIKDNVGNYNAPYLYVLALISYLPVPDLYAIKLASILFDVVLAWGVLRLTRVLRGKKEDGIPYLAFLLALWLPTVILNGAYWAQCDATYGAVCVHALALALEGRQRPALVLMGVAFSIKLQTVFLLPLWGVLWLARRVKFWELWLFVAGYGVSILPALLLGKPLGDILSVYVGQMGEYDRLTLNAPSIYQFIPYGLEVPEGLLANLGIGAAAVLVLLLLGLGLWLGVRLDREIAMAMAVVLVLGVPFFLPYMHERYFFLADVITLCWACASWRRWPAAVLACASSLASYLVYLRLEFNCVLHLGGCTFVMAVEALMMLAALLYALVQLGRLTAQVQRERSEEGT